MSQWNIENLICSKLLHDISSPVNAIGMGIELIADSPSEEQLSFLKKTYASSRFRLEFLKLFFGSTKNDNYPEFNSFLDCLKKSHSLEKYNIYINKKISSMKGDPARVFAGFLWLGIDLLPRGGDIEISENGVIKIYGDLYMSENLFDFSDDINLIDSKTIIPYYIKNYLLKRLNSNWNIKNENPQTLEIKLS